MKYLFSENNSEAVLSPSFATKLDGSIIDLTAGEEDTCLVDDAAMPDGTAACVGTTVEDDTPVVQEDTTVAGFEMDVDNAEIVGEVIEEQVIENQSMEEPLTPATDNSGTTKSQPGSGKQNFISCSEFLLFKSYSSLS